LYPGIYVSTRLAATVSEITVIVQKNRKTFRADGLCVTIYGHGDGRGKSVRHYDGRQRLRKSLWRVQAATQRGAF
jgi:hypothetical protein